MNRSGRVFISHSTVDARVAHEFCRLIEARGVRCAIAPRDIPASCNDWPGWITESIGQASAFVLVLSHHSNVSPQVRREIMLAFNEEGLPIFPVRIDPLSENDLHPGLRYYLASQQMVDAVGPVQQQSLRTLSKEIALRVLGHTGRSIPSEPIGEPGLADLLAGPFWCFRQGRDAIGLVACALIAALVLVTGWFDSTGAALVILAAAWLCSGLLLRIMAGRLAPRSARRSGSRQASLAGGLSGAALLLIALAVPVLRGPTAAADAGDAQAVATPGPGQLAAADPAISHGAAPVRDENADMLERVGQIMGDLRQVWLPTPEQQASDAAADAANAAAAAAAAGAADASAPTVDASDPAAWNATQ